MSKEFLVIYEEEDDGTETDDHFVVDIGRPRHMPVGELDVEHDLEVGLQNDSSPVGKAGFITSIVGALGALGVMIAFAVGYPDQWYLTDNSVRAGGFVRGIMVWSLVSFVLLLVGLMMTHYGRRIQASGRLHAIRVVQKS